MPEFTPGPWVAIAINSRWRGSKPIFDDGIWGIFPEQRDEHRLPICTVDRGDDYHPPCRTHAEVDARLIAAAPDLYEACKAIVSELEQRDPDGITLFSYRKRCLEAILRAEGRDA